MRRSLRNEQDATISPDILCGYMGKFCDRTRSLKRNGRLHRFCLYHRERANLNQRRVDARKRLRGHIHGEELTAKEYENVKRREDELERQHQRGGLWLNDQEIDFLTQVLFDQSESGRSSEHDTDMDDDSSTLHLHDRYAVSEGFCMDPHAAGCSIFSS